MRMPFLFSILLLALACDSSKKPEPGLAVGAGSPAPLSAGQVAPDVELLLQNGEKVRLASLTGKHVVLYFYPMDDTPGCRAEAQGFRDRQSELSAKDTVVFGVSTQDADSHQAFIDKGNLNFDLVVDSDGKVAAAFEVPVRLRFAARQTVLIDPEGKIKKIWRDVSPANHAEEVLSAIGQ